MQSLFRIAFGLAIFTITYNVIEGLVSTFFGYEDESLALFGFGVDSFIEVISGIGIVHMITRIWRNPESQRTRFETTALRITGIAFYLLVIGLSLTVIHNLWTGQQPETTFWGIVISTLSILVMWALYWSKRVVGRKLDSEAILADAECTMACISMSVVLLVSSVLYETLGIPYIDTIGAIGIIWYSWREGRECFEKARAGKTCCSCRSCGEKK